MQQVGEEQPNQSIIPQSTCKTYCTVYRTSEYKGEAAAISIANIIKFFKCNIWRRNHQRCMLLCLNKDARIFVDHIFTNTSGPELWIMEVVTRKLCSCSILANDGCTSAKNVNGTTVTVKSFLCSQLLVLTAPFTAKRQKS